MKNVSVLVGGCLAVMSAVGAVDPAPIVSVSLYENGNAFLTRRVTPEKGVSTVEVPSCGPFHGTFWHTAKTPVKVTTVSEPKSVRVTFRADHELGELIAEAEKTPGLAIVAQGAREQDAFFTVKGECQVLKHTPRDLFGNGGCNYCVRLASGSTVTVSEALVVGSSGICDPETGEACASQSWKFEGSEEPFGIQYLTRGATWAPSYRLAFGSDGKADLFMAAEIRNEIADWTDVDVSLISGFPSIRYAGTASLIGGGPLPKTEDDESGYSMDFRAPRMKSLSRGIEMERSEMSAYLANGLSAGAGNDIHYRPVGKISLKRGETVALPLGAKVTDCKRIVYWNIADRRDEWGRLSSDRSSSKGQELWDSVKFNNPFEFPLTTGAIEISEEGRIIGQGQCEWTNPGDATLVNITKALSVKGGYDEEIDGTGPWNKAASKGPVEQLKYDGWNYRKEAIAAKISVQNFRKTPTTMNVRKVLSGELVESDFKLTKTRNLPVRDRRINVERELVWEFDLQPGETKEIKVVYWFWVRA